MPRTTSCEDARWTLVSSQADLALHELAGGWVYFPVQGEENDQLRLDRRFRARSAPIPLPPVDEQMRILDRVVKLMGQCDRLQADLSQCESCAANLRGVLVEDHRRAATAGPSVIRLAPLR